jgi:hypothetical protein
LGTCLFLLSLYQPFTGAAAGIIGAGKVIQGIPVDKPGIVNFISRDVALAAEPFHRFRMDLQTAAGLDYRKIIIPDRHKILQSFDKYCFIKAIILQTSAKVKEQD